MARPENKIAAAGVAAVDDFGSAARLRPIILVAGIARACDTNCLQGQLYQRRTIQPRRASPAPKIGETKEAFGNADKIILRKFSFAFFVVIPGDATKMR